jgi:hypothetical protein
MRSKFNRIKGGIKIDEISRDWGISLLGTPWSGVFRLKTKLLQKSVETLANDFVGFSKKEFFY